MKMDEVDGLEILRKTKEELPDAEVIVVTGHGSITSAVTAMQHGAYTYLSKPLDINELRAAVQKASTRVRLIRRNAELNRRLDEHFGFEGVIGSSPQMHKRDRHFEVGRPDRQHGADPGRERHGQGTGRPGPASEQPAEEQTVRPAQHFGLARQHPRERAVRPRAGSLHRRRRPADRQVRVRQRRHAVPRRSRRDADGDADQAAARARRSQDHARRLQRRTRSQRAARRRDECRPARPWSKKNHSAAISTIGSGGQHRLAAAARPPQRYSAVDGTLPQRDLRADAQGGCSASARRPARP